MLSDSPYAFHVEQSSGRVLFAAGDSKILDVVFMTEGSNYLDPDRPGAVRLSVDDARALGEAALARIEFCSDDASIITDKLIDNALCGYRFAGLPRILAIAREAKTRDTKASRHRAV